MSELGYFDPKYHNHVLVSNPSYRHLKSLDYQFINICREFEKSKFNSSLFVFQLEKLVEEFNLYAKKIISFQKSNYCHISGLLKDKCGCKFCTEVEE